MPTSDAFPMFTAMLKGALGDRLASGAESFLEMMTPDGIMEFPYARPGMPSQVVGRQALATYLDAVASRIAFDRIDAPVVHVTTDPAVVILEFEGTGRQIATGATYEQRYISVIHLRDGRIALYRDYWNPMASAAAEARV